MGHYFQLPSQTEATMNPSDFVLKIVQDDSNTLNPRVDYENLGTMALFNKRYELGDKGHGLNASDFPGWEEMEDHLYRKCGAAVVLPVYLYDHSGITISTGAFTCPWDSGQIGFIFVTKDQARKAWDRKRISKKLLGQLIEALECEVKTYNHYLTGDVWGYEIVTASGEHVESCWGYFGEEDARAEGEAALAFEKASCQS